MKCLLYIVFSMLICTISTITYAKRYNTQCTTSNTSLSSVTIITTATWTDPVTTKQMTDISKASGYIARSNGRIVSAGHIAVIDNLSHNIKPHFIYTIILNDCSQYKAIKLYSNDFDQPDVSVLQIIKPPNNLVVAKTNKNTKPNWRQSIFITGSPYGEFNTTKTNILSGRGTDTFGHTFYISDFIPSPGFSGGKVSQINKQNNQEEVIGIIVAVNNSRFKHFESGRIIPINHIEQILESLDNIIQVAIVNK